MSSALPKSGIRFLAPREEAYLIALPLVGAAITIALWIVGRFGISWDVGQILPYIFGLIFMDGIHIIFSFVLLYSLPELKTWDHSKDTRNKSGWLKGFGPTARSLVIAVALGLLFYFYRVSSGTSTIRGAITTFLFLDFLGPAQHTVAQMRGISFCYNSSIRKGSKLNEAELKVAATCEKMERFLFNALLAGELLYWIPTIFTNADHLIIPGIEVLESIGAIIAIASCAALLVNAIYYPRQEETRKVAFLFRVILFPLKMLSVIGALSIRATHGTEYVLIYRKMVQGSKISKEKKTRIYWLTIALSLVYGVITIPVFINVKGYDLQNSLFVAIAIMHFTIRYTHYYMDSVMFRMSDPATRIAVAPLLMNIPPAAVQVQEAVAPVMPGLKFAHRKPYRISKLGNRESLGSLRFKKMVKKMTIKSNG